MVFLFHPDTAAAILLKWFAVQLQGVAILQQGWDREAYLENLSFNLKWKSVLNLRFKLKSESESQTIDAILLKWFAVQARSCSSATRRRSRELSFLPPTGIRFDAKLIDSALSTYRWNIWITIYKVQITKKFIMKHFKVLRQEEIRNRIMFKPKQLERINIW